MFRGKYIACPDLASIWHPTSTLIHLVRGVSACSSPATARLAELVHLARRATEIKLVSLGLWWKWLTDDANVVEVVIAGLILTKCGDL